MANAIRFTTVLLKAGGLRPVLMELRPDRFTGDKRRNLLAVREPYQSYALAEAEAMEWAEDEGIAYRSDWHRQRGTIGAMLLIGMSLLVLLAIVTTLALPVRRNMAAWAEQFERIESAARCQPPECLKLELDDRYLQGSDGACLAAGMFILRQFQQDPSLKYVYLTNEGWVPSNFRLIDERWARCLADEDPRQECEEIMHPGWYDVDP